MAEILHAFRICWSFDGGIALMALLILLGWGLGMLMLLGLFWRRITVPARSELARMSRAWLKESDATARAAMEQSGRQARTLMSIRRP